MRRAAIVSPIRTGVGRFGGSLAGFPAGELGAIILKALMERTKIDPERVDDVVFAHGYPNGERGALVVVGGGLPGKRAGRLARSALRIGPAGGDRCFDAGGDRRR
jgi:acetyl-CoA acetyltransferase